MNTNVSCNSTCYFLEGLLVSCKKTITIKFKSSQLHCKLNICNFTFSYYYEDTWLILNVILDRLQKPTTVARVSFILKTSFVTIFYSSSSPFLYFPIIWGRRCAIMKLKYNITNIYLRCKLNKRNKWIASLFQICNYNYMSIFIIALV